MSKRSARFKKLLSLRERELDVARAELARANAALQAAALQTAEQQEKLRAAARLHRGDGAPRTAEALHEASEWLRHSVVLLDRCMFDERQAAAKVSGATGAVQRAEGEKRKIELLLERLLEEERLLELREEQKSTDEVAAQKGLTRHREPMA